MGVGALKLFREEIALAMELRTEGLNWSRIAHGLGVSRDHLRMAVKRAQYAGSKPRPAAAKDRGSHLQATHARSQGIDADAGSVAPAASGEASRGNLFYAEGGV